MTRRGIVFRHADLEHRRDTISLYPRRRTHRGHGAARGNERDVVGGPQRQLIGEAASDGDALPVVEAVERALLDLAADRRQRGEIGAAHAAHQHAARVERRGGERLTFDDRSASRTPGTLEMRSATTSQSVSGDSSGCTSR